MADIKEVVNMVLKENETVDGKNKWVLRVVSWNDGKPKLEKRNYWRKSPDEEFKPGKAVGFDIADLEIIEGKLDDIKKILKTS